MQFNVSSNDDGLVLDVFMSAKYRSVDKNRPVARLSTYILVVPSLILCYRYILRVSVRTVSTLFNLVVVVLMEAGDKAYSFILIWPFRNGSDCHIIRPRDVHFGLRPCVCW